MRMTTSHLRPRSGFTMIELLLSMAMIVVLMSSLYTAFHIAFKAQATCKAAVSTVREASITMQIISHDFENAIEPVAWVTATTTSTTNTSTTTGTTSNTTGITSTGTITGLGTSDISETGMVSETTLIIGYFKGIPLSGQFGDSDYVEFFCMDDDQPMLDLSVGDAENFIPPYTYPTGGGGVLKVMFQVREDMGPTPVLVRTVIRNPLYPIDGYISEDEVLCRDIYSFSLRYFDGMNWVNQWDSSLTNNSIPLSIMIILEIADPDAGPNAPPSYQITRIVPLACSSLLLSGYNPETGEMEEDTTDTTTTGG